MLRSAAAGLLALTLSIAASAQAQSDTRTTDTYAYTKDNWPAEVLKRPLTLAQGLGQISVPVTFNLNNGSAGKPVYIPALLAYGVTDALTLAITHNTGFCLSGTDNGCSKLYNDIGIQGLYSLSPRGAFQVAAVAGLQLPSISDPFAAAIVGGFDSRYTTGDVALRIDPRIAIGLNSRDSAGINTFPVPVALDFHGAPIINGNRETLFVPVALQLQAAPNVALTLGSGVAGQLDPAVGSFGDSLSIPLGLSAAYTGSRVDVGASFGFSNLNAKIPTGVNASATDLRTGQVFASLRI